MQNFNTKFLHFLKERGKTFFLFLFSFFLTIQLNAADFYWVGGTGNWSDFTNHWANSSGGVAGSYANAPTAADNVFFDVNSGAAGYTITLDVVGVANNFTFSGNAFSFDGTNSLTINGTSTNSSTQAITFGGTNTYTFTGAYTAIAASETRFTGTSAVDFNNSITIGNGSTFSFTPDATTTITGDFISNSICSNPNTINSTGGAANVTFTGNAIWSNTDITNITAAGGVTLQSGTITASGGITDATTNRNLFWVGGTGNWSDETHWSLTSGVGGGECIPTANDDVNFNVNSGLVGGTVTLNIAAPVRNFNYNTANTSFDGNNTLTVNGATTIAATRTITFGGTNGYVFTGNFTAGATTTTDFTTSQALSFGNVTIGTGSTFRFAEPPSLATVSGTFSPNGTCGNNVNISSTATQANVSFTLPQTWNNVNVTLINATSNNVTVQSGTNTVNPGVTNTSANRILFWVGNTGNWSDPAHWSLSSNGTGGQCPPTLTDDVNFDAFSFNAAGQTVTIVGTDATCRNMDWTGVTNTPTFAGAAARTLTVTGSMTLAAGMNQTGNAPTFEGLVNFSSNTAQTISTFGKGLNRVRFQTGAAGEWTLQNDFLVVNQTLLNSGILNTNNQTVTSGTLSTNNNLVPNRTLNLGSSAITLTSASTTVLDYRNDTNFTLNSGTSTINITGATTTIETGDLSKTISHLNYTGAGNRVIETNATNLITFGNITTSNTGTFVINGTSPKIYNNITTGDNVSGIIRGVNTNLGNTVNGNVTLGANGATNFAGGYDIIGNFSFGNNKTVRFNTASDSRFGGTVLSGAGSTFIAGGNKNTTFVGAFTLNNNAQATFNNSGAANINSFSDINMNNGTTIAFSSITDNTVSGDINVLGLCSNPITITSNNPPTQARLQLANPLMLEGATVENIDASSGAAINVSNGTTANNINVTGNTVSRDLYWVHSVAGAGSTANWYDAANWSSASGGTTGECPPTIYDNVNFDANSFSAANQIVDMDNDAFCRNMDWTGVTNTPRLQSIGEDTDLYVGGNLIFVAGVTVGTGGTNPNEINNIYFVATEAIVGSPATLNNTIDLGIGGNENTSGRRFKRAFFDKNAATGNTVVSPVTWTFASAFNLTQEAVTFGAPTYSTGTLRMVDGDLITANFDIQVRIINANSAVDALLDMGSSRFTLRATGMSVDFRNDANFDFITPAAGALFNCTVGSNSDVYVGAKTKTLPDIDWNANDVDVFTENTNNRITFRNIILDAGVNLVMTGNSPKTYSEPLNFPNGVNTTFRGSDGTTNTNIFTGNVSFGTGVQSNFIGDNDFQGTFTVGSTVNNATGIRFTGTGRNQFQGDVTLGANSFFSLQNTSANPNIFTNVTLADADVFEFSPNTNTTVTGNFVALADCITPIIIRSSTAGNPATVDFNIAQTWENVSVTDINNTGVVVTVSSGTDGGNNAGIDFSTITTRTLYWVHSTTGAFAPANWNDPANWSLTSGGTTGECPPTLTDDVFFDVNSFNNANQLVIINVNAESRDMTWTGATGTPVFTGATTFNLQIGGSLTFINAMNFTFAGETLFRNTNTGTNTITSDGQVFNGITTFYDNTLGTGIWQLADNFATAQTLNLVDGTFTTTAANHQVTAQIIDVFTIANGIGDPTREFNANGSRIDVTLNNGLAVDFRGNSPNFVLNSTAASELHLLGIGDMSMQMGSEEKTIPNLFIDNTVVGNTINIESSNTENNGSRITFRNITALQDGLVFNVNGRAPKTYGAITFPNQARVNFRGVDNTPPTALADRNLFNGAISFGQDTRINWFDDNVFDAPVQIVSTTNNGNAVYMRQNNHFTANAPLTFLGVGQARWSVGGDDRVNEFLAPVNLLGTRNRVFFYGNAATEARFRNTLFIESSDAQQAIIDFRARPIFHAQVEFGEAAGGNNNADPVLFRRGLDFSPAPAGTDFITGIDSRVTVVASAEGASIFRDMQIAENNVLTFNDDLEVDNMNLSRFDVVNFPNSNPINGNDGVTTINNFIRARESCAGWINIRSNLTGEQAQIDFQTAHTGTDGFLYTFVQDIFNNDIDLSGLQVVEADPATVSDVGNNTNITFINAQPARDFYWVQSINDRLPANINNATTGDWNGLGDDNHWAIGDSAGMPQGCIPTANDNVWFTTLSFDDTGDEVNIDNFFSYCKDMTWTATNATRGRLRGDNLHTVQVFGNLLFAYFDVSNRNWNRFQGLFEFKGTSVGASKTIQSRGSRFNGPVEFDSPNDDWTLLDSMRLNGGNRGSLTINYGELRAEDKNIRLDHDWTINQPTGTLPQGKFIAGTGTVTFYGDPNADIEINDFQTGAACSECTDPIGLTGCSGSPFYNLTIEKRFDRRTELNTTISIYNNFHIVAGYFEDDGFQIRGNTAGTVYMYDNTLLRIGVNNRATTFPTCYPRANITLANGTADGFANNNYFPETGSTKASIVEYRCPDDQLIRGLTYGTLYLRSDGGGNNTKRFTGSATINGDFFIDNNQRIRDMGFQITGNDFNTTSRFRMDNNAAIYIGTNEDATQNTYPISGFEPDGMTFPPTNTEFEATYGATNIVTDNIATVFPKFTNAGELDDLATGGKIDFRNTSYVIYNAGSPQEVASGFTYSSVRLRATGLATIIPKTVTRHNLISDSEMRVGRELRIENFNSLIDDGNQIVGVGTPNLEAQANTQLILGNQTVATLFPTIFVRANIDLDPNDHETIYNSDVNQFMSNEPVYGNLTLTAPNSINAALIEKRFRPDPAGTNAGLTADINGNLLINPRNHLIDEGNQITGLAPKSVTMNSDAPLGESRLTLGTNTTDIATEFPLTFGTVVLNDLTTVIYNAGGAGLNQLVRGTGLNGIETGTDSYYNLIIQSNNEFTGIKTLQAPTRIRNNFTIRRGNRFEDNRNQVTGSTSTAAGVLTMENGATLYVGLNNGGIPTVFPTNYERARIILDNNSTVRYQSRRGGTGQLVSSEPIYGNLFLTSGIGSAGANFTKQIDENPVIATNPTLTVTRDLTVDYRVSWEDLGVQIIGNATNNLLVEDGSELVLGTGTTATLFPSGFTRGNTDLSPLDATKSIVIYNSSIAGNDIAGGAGVAATEINNPIYGDVILRSPTNAAVTKNLLGNVVIRGDLTIENNNTLETTGSNFNINLAENWTCQPNGVFNSQQGRVILDGTTEQRITTNAQKFYQLEASSTGGGFRMMDDITIKENGQTIFNTGLFIPDDIALGTNSTIMMVFERNATIGGSGTYSTAGWISTSAAAPLSANGPSNVSHVVGKVQKVGDDAFMFPIGNGTSYAPAGLSQRNSSTSVFEARYVGPRLPTLDGYDVALKEASIQVVSNVEYWLINNEGAADDAFVYLSWEAARSVAYQPEGLLVLRWDNPTPIWQNRLNGGYTNASAQGVLVSQAKVSTFSPFTLGSNTNFNPLPLDLLAFDAKIDGESVKVTWETTNEIDNSHFMVERSQDSNSFGSLGRVNAKGTGQEGTFNYQFWDAEPFDGLSYYRLKMFDVDGTFKYSPVRSILFEKVISGIKGEVSLYPNPNGGARFYLNLEGKLTTDAQVEIIDMIGRTIHKQDVQKGAANIIVTPMRVLPAGTYILRFVTPQETITKKFVVE